MKTRLNKIISTILVAVMLVTAAPLSGFVGLDLNLDWLNFTTKASAASYSGTCGTSLTWSLNTETGKLIITGTGAMYNYNYGNYPWYSYRSSINSVTITDGVTSIGAWAFYICDSLTSVTIPDSVTTIGDFAFRTCTSLTSVTIPDSVTTVGNYAFTGCDNLTRVTIPDSVTTIGDYAFQDCDNLTRVTILDGVTTIGNGAFSACTNLTSVTIPDSVTTIGNNAFFYCPSLISVTIPDSVTTIGDYAFYKCTGLTSVTMGDSVTTIGDYAFSYCIGLTDVYYNGTQEQWDSISIGSDNTPLTNATIHFTELKQEIASGECGDNLTWELFDDGELVISGVGEMTNYSTSSLVPWYIYCSSIKSVTIADGVTTIGDRAFSSCDNLTSVTITDGVTLIGEDAFYGCYSLTNIIIPNSVTTIGRYAFSACTNLTSVTIPDSVTIIGEWAFSYCDNLTSITIGNSVTTIGNFVFTLCTNLTSVTIPDSVTTIGYSAFEICNIKTVYYNGTEEEWAEVSVSSGNDALLNAEIIFLGSDRKVVASGACGDNLTWELFEDGELVISGTGAMKNYSNDSSVPWYSYRSSVKSVTIPDSVTTIGSYAFSDCTSLTSVTIPDGVISIGNYAFFECTSLKSVTIPDSVTVIGDCSFAICTSLTDVIIPDGVTTIESAAFSNCHKLKSVTIPKSVISIGIGAFALCTLLTEIVVDNKNPAYSSDEYGVLFTKDKNTLLQYPVYNESTFYMIPDGVTSIGYGAFAGHDSLANIVIPDGVTTIENLAFYGCTRLNSITIPDSVASIGDQAFAECPRLADVYFGGTEEEWNAIEIGGNNESLLNANICFIDLVCDHINTYPEHKDSSCSEYGYDKVICDDCGATVSETELPLLDHSYKAIVSNPTCQNEGFTVCICAVCKYAYISEITDPVDHDMRWVMVTKPTSSADGVKNYSCSYCGLVEDTKVVPAFMISDKSVANIDFDSNTISGFDAGATSINDYVSVETDGYSFTCDSAVIGTGTVIELTDGDTVITEFTAVVFGDVNGDGWYDGTDSIIVSCLANGLLSKDDVSPAFYTAADCNHDGVIDSFDVAILEQAGLLLSGVDQSKSNEELATDEAFIEYLDLIDQTPEEEDVEDEIIEDEVIEAPETEKFDLIEFIITIIKKFFELLLSSLPI